MSIKVKSIIDGTDIDSAKMSDIAAEIFEKQHELLELCCKYDVPFFSAFVYGNSPKERLMSQHIAVKKENPTEEEQKELNRRADAMFRCLAGYVSLLTGGQAKMIIVPKDYEYPTI